MPDPPKSNVFAPEFLQQAFEREPSPITASEAEWAGPWKVVAQGGGFFVVRESGGKPAVVTDRRETALLLAAVLPMTGREPLYWTERDEDEDKATLRAARGKGVVAAGQLWSEHRDVAESLSVAEYLLRCPTALALFLEAAPFEALEQAGAMLARRLSQGPSSPFRLEEDLG